MTQKALFDDQTQEAKTHGKSAGAHAPLAERMRPQSLSDIIGQPQLLGPDGRITRMIKNKQLQSMILWGPPGCGKTTLARLLAHESGAAFQSISAIFSGVADLKKIFAMAEDHQRLSPEQPLVLFVDEIHRFNKAQQDAFLPHIESGLITLIGATTENPSFALNPALLSRCPVQVLNRLGSDDLNAILSRSEEALGHILPLDEKARRLLLNMADGDARYLLNMAETLFQYIGAQDGSEVNNITADDLPRLLDKRSAIYDSHEEAHYNLISALHKSVRGSDPDAALYWFARMLEGGEDPHFLARRITRMASEDIGLAAPQALSVCLHAWESYERLGSPEGELALAEALVYLATAPKSNAVYKAYKAARRAAKEHGSLMPPAHILNAPTQMMKDIGYSQGYLYDHDVEGGISGQNYFPDEMTRQNFYTPKGEGFEHALKEKLAQFAEARRRYAVQNKNNVQPKDK